MQVTHVSGCLQALVARSYEWRGQSPMWIFNGDVLQAFDFMSHELVQEAACSP